MSEPPNTSTTAPPNIVNVTPFPPHSYKNHQTHHHLPPVVHGGVPHSATNLREYRKGNWTLEETLVLITAKRLDDERRVHAAATTSVAPNSRAAAGGELRWKWVENYCWSNGCLRSQNQCNDKWDNLLRDYKKVREYEVRSTADGLPSYWSLDKTHRKDRNLPSNMVLGIYEALNDVVQRKTPQKHHPHQPLSVVRPPPPPLPPPLPPPEFPPPPAASASVESSGTDDDNMEKTDNESKRRRVRDIGSSIVRSTKLLARTLKSFEGNKEKRHRERMELEHQRLRLEEARNEVNRQGIAGLITSVNKLSGAIQALVSDKRDPTRSSQ